MRSFPPLLLLCLVIGASPSSAGEAGDGEPDAPDKPESMVQIQGQGVRVRWSDGDTFRFLDGPWKGRSARMTGFNTLENYGPVHRWGRWSAEDLWALARSSAKLASSKEWTCTTDGREDSYRRILVHCEGLPELMIGEGHAMVFAADGDADPALLAVQSKAQRKKKGMWKKGVPAGVITSLHSITERGGARAYNRIVDTRSGAALPREHGETYTTCQWVCEGEGKAASCMLYVPFENRYRNKPECLPDAPKAP